jgi:hypothetical protein
MWTGFWTSDLLGVLPIASGLSAYALYAARTDSRRGSALLVAFACAFVGSTWLTRLHEGGYVNTLMPAHAAIAALFGLGYARASRRLHSLSAPLWHCLGRLGLYGVCMAQFGALVYNPTRQIPTSMDAEAGRRLVERMASIDGEVYLPFHGYLPVLAGKRTYAHEMAIRDIFKSNDDRAKQALTAEIDNALRTRRFDAIILDAPSVFAGIEDWYDQAGSVFQEERVFWPVAGRRIRPSLLYLARDDQRRGAALRPDLPRRLQEGDQGAHASLGFR